MKVLFVCSGNSADGIGTVVSNQAKSLKRQGVSISFYPITGKGLTSYLKHAYLLNRYLNKNTFDIIHAHYSLSGITAALAGCKPLIVSLMGSDTKAGLAWKIIIRIIACLKWKEVIVKSESMRKDISISRAIVIPNGVDLEKIKQRKNLASVSKKKILFAANPARREKNFELAGKAIKLLNDPRVDLHVVHSVSYNKITEEIKSADVLLLTSLWEGSPNIIKEAMACNCPVVATRVGDIAWLFGDEPGHFLTNFKPEDVAEKIRMALQFSEKHGRTKGRERIVNLGLDSESVARRIVGVYGEVLGKRQRGEGARGR